MQWTNTLLLNKTDTKIESLSHRIGLFNVGRQCVTGIVGESIMIWSLQRTHSCAGSRTARRSGDVAGDDGAHELCSGPQQGSGQVRVVFLCSLVSVLMTN